MEKGAPEHRHIVSVRDSREGGFSRSGLGKPLKNPGLYRGRARLDDIETVEVEGLPATIAPPIQEDVAGAADPLLPMAEEVAPLDSHALVATKAKTDHSKHPIALPQAPTIWCKQNDTPIRILGLTAQALAAEYRVCRRYARIR